MLLWFKLLLWSAMVMWRSCGSLLCAKLWAVFCFAGQGIPNSFDAQALVVQWLQPAVVLSV
jgi:hypothetical protein